MKYILIILALGWGGGNDLGIHSHSVEFNSIQSCRTAQKAVMAPTPMAYRAKKGLFQAYCIPKGDL